MMVPEDRLIDLSNYIDSLEPDERATLMTTKMSADKTFADICEDLTPEHCSHRLMRLYIIPFLNRLEVSEHQPEIFVRFR